MKNMRRGFSLLLSTVLVLGMMPVQGFAADCQHDLVYSAEGESIVETCANAGCEHRETATLELEGKTAYTGKEVKPLKAVYSAGWQGEKNGVITYVNNIEVTRLQETAAEPVSGEQTGAESQPAPEDAAEQQKTADPQGEPGEQKEPEQEQEVPEEPKIPAGTLTIAGASITRTFAVEKAVLTVTATAAVAYGDDEPVYTLNYAGLAEGDKAETVLSGDIEVTGTYTKGANAEDTFDILVDAAGVTVVSDRYTLETKNGTGTVAARKLAIGLDNTEYTYDGTEHTPQVVVDGLVDGAQLTPDYKPVNAKTAGTYTVSITGWTDTDGVEKNYELPVETELTFKVSPREVAIDWGTLTFLYDGEKHLPEPKITNRVGEDEVSLDLDRKEGETDRGSYKLTVLGLNGADAGNYALPEAVEKTFTIELPAQDAPAGVAAEAETVLGKADGKLTQVAEGMEYKNKAAGESGKYTKINGTEVAGLAAGTYLVRYGKTDTHKASDDVEVTVHAGPSLKINLPAAQAGYTLTAEPAEVGWNGSSTITFAMADGYVRTGDFAIKVNGETVKLDKNGKYTIEKMQQNADVTVTGVEPVIAMELMGEEYRAVEETVTFDLYSKTVQTLTISSGLEEGGIYYAETKEAAEPGDLADSKWTEYTGPVTISNTDRRAVFYAKVVDASGAVYYASTQGVVFDTTKPVIQINGADATSGKAYYTTLAVTATDDNLEEVRLNGLPKPQPISLAGNVEKTYVIRAEDKAGNQEQITVIMHPVDTLKASEGGLNSVKNIRDNQCANATEEEKAALDEILDNMEVYRVILQIRALPEAEAVEPYNEDHRDAYDLAREAFNDLTTAQKRLVSQADKDHLDDVEDALAYKILTDEDDLQWEKKSKVDLVVKVNGPNARFEELQIAGKVVAASKYTHKADAAGTKITIDDAYLETLTTGKKTIKVVYSDGSTDGSVKIEIFKAGSLNPKTGDDGILLWMAASVLSLACLAAVAFSPKKRKFQA